MDQRTDGIDAFTEENVRAKVRRLIGKFGYTSGDREDLEQQVVASVLQGQGKFDPDKATRPTFISRLTDRAIASIIRERCAEKRDYRREVQATRAVERCDESNDANSSEAITERAARSHRGAQPRSDQSHAELRLDLEVAMDSLPESHQKVWKLRVGHSIPKVAQMLGISERQVRKRISEIRRHCEALDLQDFLRIQ